MLFADTVALEIGAGSVCAAAAILGAFILLGFYVAGKLIGSQLHTVSESVAELRAGLERHDDRLDTNNTRLAVLAAKLSGSGGHRALNTED